MTASKLYQTTTPTQAEYRGMTVWVVYILFLYSASGFWKLGIDANWHRNASFIIFAIYNYASSIYYALLYTVSF